MTRPVEPDLFGSPPSEGDVLSVTELTARIKRTLERSFRFFRVEGEVSNYKLYEASGHRYFTLKDEGAQIRVVLFRGRDRHIYGEIRDGQTVIVTGSLGVYEKKGEYQVYAQSAEVRGAGNLLVELERRKRKLADEGLFDPGKKRPLPPFPRRIGIVTSRHGAALRDMVRVARSRFPGVSIVLAPSLVQGAGAAADISAALEAMYRHGGADVIIAGRGGGSIEDLWAFNEEEVVRALARSPVPTISAVGHETDFTLSDLAADQNVTSYFLVCEKETRTGQSGKAYLRLELGDRTGTIEARMWDNFEEQTAGISRDLADKDRAVCVPGQRSDIRHERVHCVLARAEKIEVPAALSRGTSRRQTSMAWAQRGWNLQPCGGSIMLHTEPLIGVRYLAWVSSRGIEFRRPTV